MSSPTLLYEFNSFRIDVTQRLLLCDNKLVHLTLKEFAVLLMLVQNSDRVVEKEEFLRKIWNDTLSRNKISHKTFLH
ncbi:MAG: winged helix-turn-helix domain-containing protein [Pyrinomonadaceae bacterium]